MEDFIQSSNIHDEWLNNIYENIQKLEEYERLVREGCSSLLDYVNIPLKSRSVVIGITQFKNLKFIITEFKLLLAKLTPKIDSKRVEEFEKVLSEIDKALKIEKIFIKYRYNSSNEIIETIVTDFFNSTVETLHKTKIELFKEIKSILYIGNNG